MSPDAPEISEQDISFMRLALKEAEQALALDEVPVGAVLVGNGKIIARSGNRRETTKNPLAHAEILVIETAAQKLQSWRLSGLTLYITLEPCVMCAGAIVQSRIARIVYGATDPKGGAIASLYQICSDARLNHRPQICAGVLAQECGEILTNFFAKKRVK